MIVVCRLPEPSPLRSGHPAGCERAVRGVVSRVNNGPDQNTEGEEWRSVPAQTLSILAAVLGIMIVVVPYFSSVFS